MDRKVRMTIVFIQLQVCGERAPSVFWGAITPGSSSNLGGQGRDGDGWSTKVQSMGTVSWGDIPSALQSVVVCTASRDVL